MNLPYELPYARANVHTHLYNTMTIGFGEPTWESEMGPDELIACHAHFRIYLPSQSDSFEIPYFPCLAQPTRSIQSGMDKSMDGITKVRPLSLPATLLVRTDVGKNKRTRPLGFGANHQEPILCSY